MLLAAILSAFIYAPPDTLCLYSTHKDSIIAESIRLDSGTFMLKVICKNSYSSGYELDYATGSYTQNKDTIFLTYADTFAAREAFVDIDLRFCPKEIPANGSDKYYWYDCHYYYYYPFYIRHLKRQGKEKILILPDDRFGLCCPAK